MKQLRDFSDERQRGSCVYCGTRTATRDHVPPKVFLDKPYPENLPVVAACRRCNLSSSLHEEYVACLIECVVTGEAAPEMVGRDKIRLILKNKPSLCAALRQAKKRGLDGNTYFSADNRRVADVLLKLARGHVAYELGIPHPEMPCQIHWAPIQLLSCWNKMESELDSRPHLLPEIGSRNFQRSVLGYASDDKGWVTVQPGRYRYAVFQNEHDTVRLIINEYLECQVAWE